MPDDASRLARMETKIDNLCESLRHLQSDHDRVVAVEIVAADNRSEIDKLRVVSGTWSVINSIAIGLAAWLGVNK